MENLYFLQTFEHHANAQQEEKNLICFLTFWKFTEMTVIWDVHYNFCQTVSKWKSWEKASELLFWQCEFHCAFGTFPTGGLCLIMTVKLKSKRTFQHLPQNPFPFTPHLTLIPNQGPSPSTVPPDRHTVRWCLTWTGPLLQINPHPALLRVMTVTMATNCYRLFTKSKSKNTWTGLNKAEDKRAQQSSADKEETGHVHSLVKILTQIFV